MPQAPTSRSLHGALKVTNLECIRGDAVVFSGLCFELQAGEILQVTGGNGSGKTSLLRILSGLARATAGTIEWHGADIDGDRAAWQAAVSYLGHLNGTTGALSARENLNFTLALVGRPPAALDTILYRVGLAQLADTPAARLSAGQRQRIALARLIQSDAPIWILDEPLTALDGSAKRLIEDLLTDHAATQGLAVVSTHQPLTVAGRTLRQLDLSAAGGP